MFTRMMSCKLKLDKKEEFLEAARQLRNAYKDQAGFVDLLTFLLVPNTDSHSQALTRV